MTVQNVLDSLELQLVAGESGLGNEIKGGFIGDLLSWVMANLKEGNIWITILGHVNVIAVASLNDASGVIVAENAKLDNVAIAKANDEGIPVMYSSLSAYELAKKLCELGI